jgi:sugar porter (SP) family MFS transporter
MWKTAERQGTLDLHLHSNSKDGLTAPAKIPPAMWVAVWLITLQSFVFGYEISALNTCLVTGEDKRGSSCHDGSDVTCPTGSIFRDLNLSTLEVSLATSLLVVGAWVGCLAVSRPSEAYGRKAVLMWTNFVFIAGTLFVASGVAILLYIGRFICGLGVGATSVLVPVLLSELASAEHRGIITTLHQVALTFAILISALLGYGLVTFVPHGWQYTLAFSGVPPLVMLIFRAKIPESPKWLVHQGRIEDAVAVLQIVRPVDHNAVAETDSIIEDSRGDAVSSVTWAEVFAYKRAVIIGCLLTFFQAFTGINSVVFYSTTIFGFAGFSQAILATASFGVVNFVSTVWSASLVDKMGRKKLLLGGTIVMLIGLLVLSPVLLTSDGSVSGLIAVLALLVYVFGFAIGMGAVIWVIMSEMIPTRVRTKAVSLFLCISWGSNLIIGLVTLTAIDVMGGVTSSMTDDQQSQAEKVGVAYLYLFFAGMCVISILFIVFMVPETKGKTPSALQGGTSIDSPLLSEWG